VGGKAARLVWLQKNRFAVPDAWVLSKDAFVHMLRELPPGTDPKTLLKLAPGRTRDERCAEAHAAILRVSLPSDLVSEIEALWGACEASCPWGLAVRSSATCEDGELVSMAGLADSVLGVRGPLAIARAVGEVWASIASGRAISYLATHGVKDVQMAVVIQRVVVAEAAGVMFTRAPDRRAFLQVERIVNVGCGLGASVVSGMATPDVLRIDTRGRVIEAAYAHKTRATVVGSKGLEEQKVNNPDEPALEETRLAELADLASRLERLDSAAWDVEFVCDAARTWIVQARPVTGLGFPEGGDAATVWSNANVGEALPGVATPFTWSIARGFSETGFRRAFAALGCRVPKNAVLVSNVHGRFYLNLSQFMRIAAQVPFLDPRTLVELGGGGGGDELAAQVEGVSRLGFYARLPLTALRLGKEQLRIDTGVDAFEAYAEKVWRANTELDLAILPDEGLAKNITETQALLEQCGTVMLTCASTALGSHLALKLLLERVAPTDADRLAQSLTSGIRDLESARPAIGIMHIASIARREPEARLAIELESTMGLDAIPEGPTKRALASFIDLYGHRAVREAELSTPRWREDHKTVLTMLRIALRGEGRDVEEALARGKLSAETETSRLLPKLTIVEQTALRHLVARARKAARLRERMRAWVTRVLGMLRSAALDADRRLLRRDPQLAADYQALASSGSQLAMVRSAFFLTVDEVKHALRHSRSDVSALVKARRAEFARDCARPELPSTFMGAPPPVVLPPSGGDTLRGLPAASGVVEANARVLFGPEEMGSLQPGEVLVVHTTDVGWTPLFLLAAGIVTELGGPLSHAAIVAREFGVPSVVNVTGATRAIKTGDRVRVDGDRGIVEKIRSS
jgi:pyruvate,water dikinase